MNDIGEFSLALADVIPALGSASFPERLVVMLSGLVAAEDGSVLHYRKGQLPTIEFNESLPGKDRSALDAYLAGPFLLDPFYRAAALEGRFGVFRLTELAPKGFKESEYYRSWYRNCGYEDECGLLVELGEDDFINVSLGYITPGQRFSRRQAQTLEAVLPVVNTLCRQHWRGLRPQGENQLRQQLHTSLAAFGASVLTGRERQVTELVLLGNSTRVIAEKLGISTETVKLHRKHAYAKLDVSSQAELFYLFMEALAHSPNAGGTDPLVAYHSKPARNTDGEW